jgi:uncharacterized membrane protein (DUF2068 family)
MSTQTRTLRLIATWKLVKGALLLLFGVSLLVLDIREPWYDAVLNWIQAEIFTPRRWLLDWLLQKVLTFLTGDNLRLTGIVALLYAVLLAVEGVGVFLEQRWAEWLMVLATASLIPFEAYHLAEKFTWFRVLVLVVNVGIVWYLWRTLRTGERAGAKSSGAVQKKIS